MSLRDVLIDELRDLYSAENQQLKAMPKASKGVESDELKAVLQQHVDVTKGQVERLRTVFGLLGKKPTGKHCEGMEGAIKEVKEPLEEEEQGTERDSMLVGGVLRVEHYEVAGYTVASAIAKQLGEKEIAQHLAESLKEEQDQAKQILNASKKIFKDAMQEENPDETEDEAKPKSAKQKQSEQESEEDERDAEQEMTSAPAKSSARKSPKKK